MDQVRLLYLQPKRIIAMFIYYIALFLIGIIGAIWIVLSSYAAYETTSINYLATLSIISASLLGNSIYYIRKLYQSCLRGTFIAEDHQCDHLKEIGTTFYFITRPFFAVAFSFILIIGLRSGILLISKFPLYPSENFIYFTLFTSFFIGFLTGDILSKIKEYGSNLISNLFKNRS